MPDLALFPRGLPLASCAHVGRGPIRALGLALPATPHPTPPALLLPLEKGWVSALLHQGPRARPHVGAQWAGCSAQTVPPPCLRCPCARPPGKSSSKRRSSDIISLLVSIYGSKDLFINEYRSLLADRLLHQFSFSPER